MADPSDPFDDDGFFSDIDISALEEVEAQAISATQAVRPPNRFQNTTGRPQKEPRPINTEPRAGGKSTFGFGELGKHTHPANEQRYVDNVEKRKQYWGIKRDDDEDEEDYPTVTVDATGKYDLARDTDEDAQVVDTHAPGGRGMAYDRIQRNPVISNQGTQARREAVVAAAGPSRLPAPPMRDTSSLNQQQGAGPSKLPPPGASTRVLARSASVGKQVFAPRPSRLQPGLAPISSQSNNSQSMPSSSQGSQSRRSVLQLDEEKRKREELEKEVERLQAQLRSIKPPAEKRHWTHGLEVDMGDGDPQKRMKELQAQLWQAKGEVETIRRLQKTDSEKHQAETSQLKASITERDRLLAEKEREAAARVESVKSQAIFATHAAFNSSTRTRNARATAQDFKQPGLGSPTRRQNGQITTETLGQRKPDTAEVTPARFGGLNNGFALSPKLRRTGLGRQSTSGPKIERQGDEDDQPPGSPRVNPATEKDVDHVEGSLHTWDEQSQLVHHVFNFRGTSRDTGPFWDESLLNRLLRFQTKTCSPDYARYSDLLLQTASNIDSSLQAMSDGILSSLSGFLELLVLSVMNDDELEKPVISALVDVLDLISSTLYLFPNCFNDMAGEVVGHLRKLVQLFAVNNLGRRQSELAKLSLSEQILVADLIVQVCETLCWLPGSGFWDDDSLVIIIFMLSDPQHSFKIVKRAFDLLHAASCRHGYFRALTSSSSAATGDDPRKSRIDLPLIERASKYLISAHPDCSRAEVEDLNVTILKSIAMMSLANPDAPVLLSERSSLVPALIILLHRESAYLLGMGSPEDHGRDPLRALSMSLVLLHHLVNPSPLTTDTGSMVAKSTSQAGPNPFLVESQQESGLKAIAPQGVDLQARLLAASTVKEFSGLQHIFVAALGSIAYCEPGEFFSQSDIDSNLGRSDMTVAWRAIQYLGQDLLEAVVEGPEADEIYEMYYSGDMKAGDKETDTMDLDDVDEDEEGYAAMLDAADTEA